MKRRNTARAVLLDPEDRVLLFEFVLPKNYIAGTPGRFWATPGGEIEPGEDVHTALKREVQEETGIQGCTFGPELWFGSNQLIIQGQAVETLERFFLVRSPTCEIETSNWTEIERKVMRDFKWWSASQLCETSAVIFPPRFGERLSHFLQHGSTGPEEIPL